MKLSRLQKNVLAGCACVLILGGAAVAMYRKPYSFSHRQPPMQPVGNLQHITGSDSPMDPTMMHHSNVVSEEQFIRDMIPHHTEAITLSKELVARSQNEKEKELAQNIINAQSTEVETLQGWLKDWYPNSTGISMYRNMMPNLSIVSGDSLDILYLQGMIVHHQAAVGMAQGVLKINPRQEVIDFANNIIDVQSKEIKTMRDLMSEGRPGMNNRMMMRH